MEESLIDAAISAALCRKSFFEFVKTFWPVIIAEEPVWNWHIEYICSELQKIAIRVKVRQPAEYTYYIINVPPGSSKSTICSQMYIAWVWTIDATQRFICGSYAQTIARKDAAFTQQIVNSDLYRQLFPEVQLGKDAIDHIRNSANGERYATSVGSGITGIHAHQIIIDDPLNPKQAVSLAERNTANQWIDHTLTTRKVDKRLVPTIVIMQRLHEDDPTGHILKKGMNVKHICLPAENTGNIQPPELADKYTSGLLDAVRMDRAILDEMKLNLGSYGYAGQFMQTPAPEEGGMLKKAWFKRFAMQDLPDDVTWNFVSDTAYTAKESADPSGILAYAYHDNNWYIRGYEAVRLEFPELCREIQNYSAANGYTHSSIIAVEPKASGKSLVQMLRRTTGLNIIEDTPPNKDKIARAMDISPAIESGRVFLLEGAQWIEAFLTEVSQFPNAAHDEAVDCLSIMVSRHQANSSLHISVFGRPGIVAR